MFNIIISIIYNIFNDIDIENNKHLFAQTITNLSFFIEILYLDNFFK